jgi:P2-related tail formation protein
MWRSIDLLPDSLSSDPQVRAACEAIDIELQEIYGEIPSIAFWPNLEQQTGKMLDVLAWEMHVDIHQGWLGDLTDAEKLYLINESIDWHQHKGTPWVVERMIFEIFGDAALTEWFQYRDVSNLPVTCPPGNPAPSDPALPVGPGWRYKFRIALEADITAQQLATLTTAVNAVKNLRSWMEGISRLRKTKQQSYEGSWKRFRNTTRIHMRQRINPEIVGEDYFGVGTHSRIFYEIGAPS